MSFTPNIQTPNIPLTPTTTIQEDMTLAGQRRVNIIWEVTQSLIAAAVVISNMTLSVYCVISGTTQKIPDTMTNALFLIVGFYFARTNHANIGGIGKKPDTRYEGR